MEVQGDGTGFKSISAKMHAIFGPDLSVSCSYPLSNLKLTIDDGGHMGGGGGWGGRPFTRHALHCRPAGFTFSHSQTGSLRVLSTANDMGLVTQGGEGGRGSKALLAEGTATPATVSHMLLRKVETGLVAWFGKGRKGQGRGQALAAGMHHLHDRA